MVEPNERIGVSGATMWRLLERVAGLERRVSVLYQRFAELPGTSAAVAAFWREMASEERLHALIVAAAREVFPAAAAAPAGEWTRALADAEAQVAAAEAAAARRLTIGEAFVRAEALERSELNAITQAIILHAGSGFSRLGPLVGPSGVDRHRDKVLEARKRFGVGEVVGTA
jgi:hypothetical protein